jgi:hypothetical protein
MTRMASGRTPIAWSPQPIIDITDLPPRDPFIGGLYRAWAAGIREEVAERERIRLGATPLVTRRPFWHPKSATLVWCCFEDSLPTNSEFNDSIGVLAGRAERLGGGCGILKILAGKTYSSMTFFEGC